MISSPGIQDIRRPCAGSCISAWANSVVTSGILVILKDSFDPAPRFYRAMTAPRGIDPPELVRDHRQAGKAKPPTCRPTIGRWTNCGESSPGRGPEILPNHPPVVIPRCEASGGPI